MSQSSLSGLLKPVGQCQSKARGFSLEELQAGARVVYGDARLDQCKRVVGLTAWGNKKISYGMLHLDKLKLLQYFIYSKYTLVILLMRGFLFLIVCPLSKWVYGAFLQDFDGGEEAQNRC